MGISWLTNGRKLNMNIGLGQESAAGRNLMNSSHITHICCGCSFVGNMGAIP
jgi:hypothetical protein